MELKSKFGELVRREREAQNLSIEALAHDAGLSYSYFGSMERGRRNPSLVVIFSVASALGLQPDAMVRDLRLSLAAPDEVD
ncbi:MAG: XRE family transcriptional regulator [Brevundimonas sp.]|nr:MAG: XRE family transcriptional regulator [Brevundimonas sp.]